MEPRSLYESISEFFIVSQAYIVDILLKQISRYFLGEWDLLPIIRENYNNFLGIKSVQVPRSLNIKYPPCLLKDIDLLERAVPIVEKIAKDREGEC